MRFTFKRDEKGHESIVVDDRVVWQCGTDMRFNTGRGQRLDGVLTPESLDTAIKAAEVEGFWEAKGDAYYVTTQTWRTVWVRNEVSVEVPSC